MRDRLAFCLGVHNHQPIGNFDPSSSRRRSAPTVRSSSGCEARPEVRVSVHCSGSLLEWLRERAPRTFDLLGAVASRGQVELLTGGFYEPILAVLPDRDKIGQIERADRVPQDALRRPGPRACGSPSASGSRTCRGCSREAGVEYVLVDDAHFALAGLDPDDAGRLLPDRRAGRRRSRVFPINQRLRYLIPFADADETRRVTWRADGNGRPRSPWSTTARSSGSGPAPTRSCTKAGGSIASSIGCCRRAGSS